MVRHVLKFVLACVFTLSLAASASSAETYPSHPVRFISSTPPGGPQDALARLIARALSEKLGQPFVVENHPGANTMIAAQIASVAPGDGYTLMMATDSTLSISPHLYSHMTYRAEDFVPITRVVEWGADLFVSRAVHATTLKQFVAYAKSRPGKLNYGSYGYGSNPQLDAEQLKRVLGIDLLHIPYKGSADGMTALAANDVQMMVTSVGSARPLLDTGKIRALAASGKTRSLALPNVPTFQESGYPEQNFVSWFGVVAPKGTPQPIIDLLAGDIQAFVQSDEFRTKIAPRYAWEVVKSAPAEFGLFLKADRDAYGRLIKENHIAPLD
jgi:tripartite-type tricarboxylate transporter receptor subunit TctC